MTTAKNIGQALLVLKRGDITREEVDVIVNAANSSLLGGGGVDGAIHRAAGPALLKACQEVREEQKKAGRHLGCAVGEAVITSAGALKAKYVIHTVGPDMRGLMMNASDLLKNAYSNSLFLAEKHRAKSIAFPSISTGIYAYPIEEAARIALETVSAFLSKTTTIKEVRFILFSEEDFRVYQRALDALGKNKP
jgi:O-acetyl-ADP-ribose deacetylase